ncbi:TRAP transporter large permease [Paraglaciecola marina]|uniref:TRAP transporter large permease n=1 Tax=Paraglaciecola marina TaxID=2500157 RepID=UPI00105CA11F|nr:TRAP transporter large permease [Paraglaciecola marina]
MSLVLLTVVFFTLLICGLPVAFCLAISAVSTLLFMDINPVAAFQMMLSGMNIFALLALPFFIFAGELMTRGGIAEKLLTFANSAIGNVKGGLGMVNISSSMLFGGISGSAVADVSALGSTLIPMMEKRGYDKSFAVNVTTSSATLGLLIPPSHNMIIYSIAAGGGVSISGLFAAGLIPGVLTGICLMVVSYWIAIKRNYPTEDFPGWQALFTAFVHSIPGLLTAIIILFGVISGVFTATESAAIAAFWAAIVAAFVYRSMDLDIFWQATLAACKTTAMVMLVIGSAAAFGWVLSVNDVPSMLAAILSSLTDNPILLFLLINLMLLLLGAVMDMAPLIMITTPILLPVVQQAGMDSTQFGIMLILNLGIGLITPPVGSVLFVGCAVGKTNIETVVKGMLPFYLALFTALLLITFIPSVSLWLPNWLGIL